MAVVIAFAIAAPAAGAAAYTPPPGKVYAGLTGGVQRTDYTSFVSFTGKHQPVWQLFLTWSLSPHAPLYARTRLQFAAQVRTRLMFHLTTANAAGGQVITPAAIARGQGDAYFLWLNRELGMAGQIAYVRPFGEPNQAANVYSAYGSRGYRGATHSTANYRNAFRRAALILRGGDVGAINARLRALRMPPVRTSAGSLPAPQVGILWCPHVVSSPAVAGNSARAYYPGAAYFDWMCTDIYSGGAPFGALSRLYGQFAGKPFAIGEWGFDTGADSPGFVSALFRWVRSHPRTRMILFNQGNRPGGPFRLQRRPRSAAVLRAALRDPRFVPFP